MKRRILRIITALALCLSLCPGWALASGTTGTETGPWSCGNSVTATLSADGATMTISGSGAMKTYNVTTEVPWYGIDRSKIVKVVIESGVTSIGGNAFYQFTGLTDVTIPDTIRTIGDSAFYGCSSLTSITIPASVTTIKSGAFASCASLTKVVIPATGSLIEINNYAFSGSTNAKIHFDGTLEQWNHKFPESKIPQDTLMTTGDTKSSVTVNGVPHQSGVRAGETVTVDAGTKEGHAFTGWTAEGVVLTDEQCASPKLTFTMPAGDVALTAVWTAPVASVTLGSTTTNVTTLAGAFAPANNGATVKLLANVDAAGGAITINSGTFTLDLNGHTIAGGSGGAICLDSSGVSLTICGSGSITTTAGNAVAVKAGALLHVISAGVTINQLSVDGSAVLTAGTYTGNPAITVTGGTLAGLLGNPGDTYYGSGGNPLVLADLGTSLAGPVTVKKCGHPNLTVTDNGDGAHSGACVYCGQAVEESHTMGENGVCTDCGATAVASVTKPNGDVIYVGKLADAFDTTDASRSGATVKLLADVTTESSIILGGSGNFAFTLDLNGHTITGSSGVIALRNLGFHLTIRGSGSITTRAGNAVAIERGGNLTLEGGTFSSAAENGHGIYAAKGNLSVTGEGVTVDRLGGTSPNASVSLAAGTYTGHPAIEVTGKTLAGLLSNKANAYYRDGNPIALRDLADPLAGPVTVKACQHPGGGLTCTGDGAHYLACVYCPAAAITAPEPCTYAFPETGANRNTGSCVCGSEVIVTVTGTEGLVYDGSYKQPSVTVTRDGHRLRSGAEYREAYSNNKYAGSNASVTVTMGGISWKGSGTYTQTFSIAKADLEASAYGPSGMGTALGSYGAKLSELQVYDLTVKLKGTNTLVSGTWKLEGDAIPSVSDSGKEVTVTFVPRDGADSCNPLTAKVQLNIIPAEPLVPKTGDLTVVNKRAHTYTYGLGALRPDVPEGLSLGSAAVTYTLGAVSLGSYYDSSADSAKIEGQTLTLPIQAVDTNNETDIGTITVIIHTGNYMDMTATINVRSVNKTIPTGAPTLSAATLTYGQTVGAIALSGSMMDGNTPVPGKFTWSSPDNRPAAQEKYAAAWTFEPDDTDTYAIVTGTSLIQVLPASITGAAIVLEPAAFRYDGQPHSPSVADVTRNGTWLTADVDYTAEIPEGIEAGSYTVTLTGTGNYTGTATAVFTINPVAQKPLDQTDDDGHELRLEVETGLSTVPAALAGSEKYNSPEKIKNELRTRVKAVMSNAGENIAVFDVTLQYKDENGTWHNVESDHFPAEGVTAVLPYPAGTGAAGYTFTVQHLISSGDKAGEMETLSYELTADGLKCRFNSLSPVAIGYQAAARPVDPTPPGSSGGGWTGGWSGVSTYAVTIEKSEHGKVTSNRTNASSGSTITLTVTPDTGYVLDTLTVTDGRGNAIKLTGLGGGRYAFTMPGGAVTVKAVFAPLPEDVEQPCDGGADCPSRAYADLSAGTWYHEAVDYVLRNNLMGGYGNGKFGPNENLSRAQLAQILFNKEGRPGVNYLMQYGDVADGAWYAEAIRWATSEGIVGGYGNGMFGPNDNITREQLAVMLWRYAGSPAATETELHFADADKASGWAMEALRWAVENGVMTGKGDGILDPAGLASRAETAQILKNYTDR